MKIEMHAHTAEVSPCGKVPARAMAHQYVAAQYDAVVVTDHFNEYVLESFPGSPRQRADRYLDGFRFAREEGEKLGLTVILGMESCIQGGREDFLVYGIDFDFFYAHPTFYRYTQAEAFAACCEYGALFFQAHPCRSYCHPRDPKLLHGVEVFNGNPRHQNNNEQAKAWALENGILLHTSGSDFHQPEDCARGGILLNGQVSTSKELAAWLRNKPIALLESI